MDFDSLTDNPVQLVFGAIAAIVGFFIAGVYTHSLTTMVTPVKWLMGILAAIVCGIAGYLVSFPS